MYERVFGQGFVSPGGMTTTKVSICEDLSVVFNDLLFCFFFYLLIVVEISQATDFVVLFDTLRNLLAD